MIIPKNLMKKNLKYFTCCHQNLSMIIPKNLVEKNLKYFTFCHQNL